MIEKCTHLRKIFLKAKPQKISNRHSIPLLIVKQWERYPKENARTGFWILVDIKYFLLQASITDGDLH